MPPTVRPSSEVALRSLLNSSHLSFGIAHSSLEELECGSPGCKVYRER